ncbi:hypothetical protein QTJ16_007127 [Diplocarpon rosae]|uniref:Myb-like domain-containing protein n=1 Tax=Diplocarpon rosae TaxID=946125 RepID=A0AAD9SRY2_9HELO|nr:hypothetical protein QTJ16_007127 [Diplocarpon rosae]
MPKGHRSVRSQGFYRVSPASTPASQYAAISSRPAIPSPFYTTTSVPLGMSQQGYSQGYFPNGGPVQHPLAPPYTSMPPAPPQQQTQPPPPPPSLRPSSGAWTPSDDQTLMTARAQGLNWAPIQHAYFPSKTPNACRKRHERLMERRSADDWDSLKLENLAKKYMVMRREIWAALAAQTGEKWNVVEQKVCPPLAANFPSLGSTHTHKHTHNSKQCMSQGLKNLQTAARSGTRRERLLPLSASHANPRASYGPNTNFTDDSGYADELDLDLDLEPEPGYESDRSGSYHSPYPSNPSNGSAGLRLSGSGNAAGAPGIGIGVGIGGGGYVGVGVGVGVDARFLTPQQQQQQQQQQQHQQAVGRVPSMDMGISAIINRGPPQPSSGVRRD